MVVLKYFTEDMPLRWQISNLQIAKRVVYYTADDNNRHIIIDLPFIVKNNIVYSILPAYSKFFIQPELVVEIRRKTPLQS